VAGHAQLPFLTTRPAPPCLAGRALWHRMLASTTGLDRETRSPPTGSPSYSITLLINVPKLLEPQHYNHVVYRKHERARTDASRPLHEIPIPDPSSGDDTVYHPDARCVVCGCAEPKRGGGRRVVEAEARSLLDAGAWWQHGQVDRKLGCGGICGIIGWRHLKMTPREWPKGSLKHQTRDNSKHLSGCLFGHFQANELGLPKFSSFIPTSKVPRHPASQGPSSRARFTHLPTSSEWWWCADPCP